MAFKHKEPQWTSTAAPSERNLLAASANISPLTTDRYMQRGRRLRSAAYLSFVIGVGRVARALATRLLELNRRWRAVRHTERALRGLSPQILRDIGIDGHQIPAIARGIDTKRLDAPRSRAHVQLLHPKASRAEDCYRDEAA